MFHKLLDLIIITIKINNNSNRHKWNIIKMEIFWIGLTINFKIEKNWSQKIKLIAIVLDPF
jgi:hypothetical protein